MGKDRDSPGVRARSIVRGCDKATLATALAEDAWPYASLVMCACGPDSAPLLLISDIAEHTRNLGKSSRASLLFDATAGLANPLTGSRVTVLGNLTKCGDDALLGRYVARHPGAEAYAGFTDFHLFRMEVERAHMVAGFGDIVWIEGADVRFDTAAAAAQLADAETEIVAHMNEDHGDAVRLYATALLGRQDGDWTLTGVDPEGCDLRFGGAVARLDFEHLVDGPASARAELVRLVGKARSGES